MEAKKVAVLVLDVVIYAIILISWRYVDSSVPKVKRGFFCGDPALSLPFKKSTVRGIWLHINFYGVPIAIWIIESCLQRDGIRKGLRKSTIRALNWFKFYFFTFISLIILMSTVKNLSGVHRPFFFDICKPDLAVNCTNGAYISSDFQCMNQDASEYLLSESSRSFPSGHVLSVVYSCGVFMWYLQTRISKFPLLLTFTHLLCFLWMAVCSITRISDNWHFVTDVLGAIIMTLPFVVYVCHSLCKNFQVPTKERTDVDE